MLNRPRSFGSHTATAVVAFCALTGGAQAADLPAPPTDPRESITYWRQHTIAPESDAKVREAQEVFQTLLRTWDRSQVEPALYVVKSSAGPWAASLENGAVLLSEAAIEACHRFGRERAPHLLAFVLAHELAHQRADDLWHRRFFRLAGDLGPDARAAMLRGLELDRNAVSDLEQREARADHDGLVIMGSVGYDPFQVLEGGDFFTRWVENLWGSSCSSRLSGPEDACRQAQSRAVRARTQLEDLAAQTTLYEMGLQSLVAGQVTDARRFLTAYGRAHPSRGVYNSLGLTFLNEAVVLQQALRRADAFREPAFSYPLILDADPQATPAVIEVAGTKRGSMVELQAAQKKLLVQAIDYFEKAERLEPDHRTAYWLQALAHLLDRNPYMARGVLLGKFHKRFGSDPAVDLLEALLQAQEGAYGPTMEKLTALQRLSGEQLASATVPAQLLRLSAFRNAAAIAVFQDDAAGEKEIWQQLAGSARREGDGLLFQLALKELSAGGTASRLRESPQVAGKRLGDRYPQAAATDATIWLDGEAHQLYRVADGGRLLTDRSGVVVRAWQEAGAGVALGGLRLGDPADRPLKQFGPPSRQWYTQRGQYLAYDHYGLGIRLVGDRVAGWFLYDPH